MTNLYGYAKDRIKLEEALNRFSHCLEQAIGLFYSVNACRFGKIDRKDGRIVVMHKQEEIALEGVFEARVFNEASELRWLNEYGGTGTAVLLREAPIDDIKEMEAIETIEAIATLEQTYVLWGEGTNADIDSGWSRLATARVGKLDVPIANVGKNGRVYLRSREYLGKTGQYSNVCILEERLIGIT